MSIIDSDKTTGNRTTPDLNTNDNDLARKAHNTYGNTLRRAGGAVKQFMRFAQGIIEAFDSDNKRSFFLGYEPEISTRPVIRIAKEGFDAKTAGDEDLVFNSEQNVFKVVDVVTVTAIMNYVNGNSSTYYAQADQPHGLDYTPAYLAFIEIPTAFAFGGLVPSNNLANPAIVFGLLGGAITTFTLAQVNVDSTNIHLAVQTTAGLSTATYTITAKVYLLRESAV